ncbi:unnamed protein product [Moneuplotes crassus]|uniref:Calpain catalytic domain-containing protein n=1 Tax=Euplotes crassus TaxID=5936 RepID=A0AAD2D9N6_EUPCR|nr:unnamed protein product [Moneuplotes crassus]
MATVTKEIARGIFLHKRQMPVSDRRENAELVYVFSVEVKTLQILDFQADFTGSENIFIDDTNSSNFICEKIIQPMSNEVVAKLILRKEWKLKSKFKFTMKNPPLEIQREHLMPYIVKVNQMIENADRYLSGYPYEIMNMESLENQVKHTDSKFIDISFAPIDASVHNLKENPFDVLVHWRRPEDFVWVDYSQGLLEPSIFYESIEPNDIREGALGNSWFTSALATLAERPALIERLFIIKEVSQYGIYKIKICKNGEWTTVTIDDFFPCYPEGGPIFSRGHGNELWVLLLEKAYAKLHGNYLQLRKGFTNEALIDLTGCPSCCYDFNDELIRILITSGEFWDLFKSFESEGYLMSASTPGEERFLEPGEGNADESSLKPGHAYSIVLVKETKGNKLINIRNPWGNFDWAGDWSSTSPLWTEEIRNKVNPHLEESDGTFWMCFEDFIKHFRSLNVCRVRNWEEVRVKGKFIRVQNVEDPDIEVVLSKWYYSLDVNEQTRVFLGVHQEDERVENTRLRRPYLDIGIAVLRRTGDNNVELIDLKDLNIERQCELDVTLDPGSYIILPRTTGCYLRRPKGAPQQDIHLLDEYDGFNDIFESTLNDIFRKFDMLLNRELSYTEFRGFYECLGKNLSEAEFRSEILEKYCSSNRGITLRGFKEFWRDSIKTYGTQTIFGWLENLGYDQDLYSIRSRCFVMTMHSESELAVTVRDAVQTDLDNRCNIAILATYGQEADKTENLKAYYTFSEQINAYSYGVLNTNSEAVTAQIDCSASEEVIFSTRGNIIRKRVEPGELEFFMHTMGLPTNLRIDEI